MKICDRKSVKRQTFFAVAGPKGAEKSTLIQRVFEDKPGTIVVDISQDASPESITASIISGCKITVDGKGLNVD